MYIKQFAIYLAPIQGRKQNNGEIRRTWGNVKKEDEKNKEWISCRDDGILIWMQHNDSANSISHSGVQETRVMTSWRTTTRLRYRLVAGGGVRRSSAMEHPRTTPNALHFTCLYQLSASPASWLLFDFRIEI